MKHQFQSIHQKILTITVIALTSTSTLYASSSVDSGTIAEADVHARQTTCDTPACIELAEYLIEYSPKDEVSSKTYAHDVLQQAQDLLTTAEKSENGRTNIGQHVSNINESNFNGSIDASVFGFTPEHPTSTSPSNSALSISENSRSISSHHPRFFSRRHRQSQSISTNMGEHDFLVCASAEISAITSSSMNTCYSITFREKMDVSIKARGYTVGAGIGFTIIMYRRFFNDRRHQQIYGNLDANADFPPSSDDFERVESPSTAGDILRNSHAIGIGIGLLLNIKFIRANHRVYGKLVAGSASIFLGSPLSLTEMKITIRQRNFDRFESDNTEEDGSEANDEDEDSDNQNSADGDSNNDSNKPSDASNQTGNNSGHRHIPNIDLIYHLGSYTVNAYADEQIEIQHSRGNYCRKFPFVRADGVFFNRVKCLNPASTHEDQESKDEATAGNFKYLVGSYTIEEYADGKIQSMSTLGIACQKSKFTRNDGIRFTRVKCIRKP